MSAWLKENTKETCRSVARYIERPEIVGRVAPGAREISIDRFGSAERGIRLVSMITSKSVGAIRNAQQMSGSLT